MKKVLSLLLPLFVFYFSNAQQQHNLNRDITTMPEVKNYIPAVGVGGSNTVTNFGPASLDTSYFYFNTTGLGTQFGGVLFNSTSGDSLLANIPFGVFIGNSIMAGHAAHVGRLETSIFNWDYPDSAGQMEYYFDSLTHYRWFNQGIGGQTTTQIRARFMRDAIGLLAAVNDGKGNRTLPGKPSYIVMEGGVNDFSLGVSDSTVYANIEWMAEICQEYGIPCVMLNCVGDFGAANTVTGQTYIAAVSRFNKWLRDGALNKYGVIVADINGIWNNALRGKRNNHFPSSLVGADGIHFLPAGYRQAAINIFNQVKIPVLTQIVISQQIDPVAPIANYNRTTSLSIAPGIPTMGFASQTFTLANQPFDTIAINSYIGGDSTIFKVLASVNVVGTSSVTGFNHIECLFDNNPSNAVWYTQKVSFTGGKTGNINASTVSITADRYQIGVVPFRILNSDGTNSAIFTSNLAGNSSFIFNSFSALAALNGAIVSIYTTGTTPALSMNGSILATGTTNQLGSLQIGTTGLPTTSGFGIGIFDPTGAGQNALNINGSGGYINNSSGIVLQTYFASSSTSSNASPSGVRIANNWTNQTGNADTAFQLKINPSFNNSTGTGTGNYWGGVLYIPNIINAGTTTILGFANTVGTNIFNWTSGRTVVGGATADDGFTKLQVNGTLKVTDTLKTPNIAFKNIDTVNFKLEVVDLSGNHFKTSWPIFGGGSTPTLQQVITAGDSLTKSDTINYNAHNLTLQGGGSVFQQTANGSSRFGSSITSDVYGFGWAKSSGAFTKGTPIIIDTNNNLTLGTGAFSPIILSNAPHEFEYGVYENIGIYTTNATIATPNSYIDATTGALTETLPTVASSILNGTFGLTLHLKKVDASINTVTITAAGSDSIDGLSTLILATQNSGVTITAGAAGKWYIQK